MATTASRPIGFADALSTLRTGEIKLAGYVPWSSNATLVADVASPSADLRAVYKPRRGERPLHDFPAGTLCLREMAAFAVSQALGWELVPPTVLRDGPLGYGAVQLFVPHDPEVHYLAMDGLDAGDVQRIVAFDVVTNNADRKSGHVLLDTQRQLWLIDHGLTFHVEWKLRTVIWDFAGEAVPGDIAHDLDLLAAELGREGSAASRALAPLLTPEEIGALRARTRRLLEAGRFPDVESERRVVPWPLV